MSDHGHHDPGGHELEAVNSKALFRLMGSLSIVTLFASIAVIQWFHSQRRALDAEYDAQGSFRLQAYQAEVGEALEGVDGVAQDIATNPKLLAAPAPPPGWVHPDDLVGGGTPAAAAEGGSEDAAPAPAEGDEAAPAEGEGDEAAPDEGEDDDAAPAEGDAPAEDDAHADDAGEKPAAADKPESNDGNNGGGQAKPKANDGNKDGGQAKPKSDDGQGQPDNG